MNLFLLRVARQFDNFHPIPQRRWNGVEVICGGDEQNFRQIEWHIEIVI